MKEKHTYPKEGGRRKEGVRCSHRGDDSSLERLSEKRKWVSDGGLWGRKSRRDMRGGVSLTVEIYCRERERESLDSRQLPYILV